MRSVKGRRARAARTASTQAPTEVPEPPVTPQVEKPKGSTRYSVRAQSLGLSGKTRIEEIGLYLSSVEAIARARQWHEEHSVKVWVWSVRTGKVEFELEPEVKKAGAQ
jgi:hypothetical protein